MAGYGCHRHGPLRGLAQNEGDPILRGFQDPPDSAKPRVWWHWMNGNVSKEGIKADLEWMKRAGIGGFQNFDGGRMGGATLVPKRVDLEGRLQVRCHAGGSTRFGNGQGQFAGMERNGRPPG